MQLHPYGKSFTSSPENSDQCGNVMKTQETNSDLGGYANWLELNVRTSFLIIAIVIMTFYIIPSEIQKLTVIMSSTTKYIRAKYKNVDDIPFVIILGTIS